MGNEFRVVTDQFLELVGRQILKIDLIRATIERETDW
jgi:hypothetical protein